MFVCLRAVCNVDFTKMSNEIHHKGIVDHIEGNTVRVRIIQRSACSACHAKSMCAASESKEKWVDIVDLQATSYRIGQFVVVCGKSSMGFLAVFLAFCMPLLVVLAVLIAAKQLGIEDTTAALAALVALVPWYALLYAKQDVLKNKFVFTLKNRTK